MRDSRERYPDVLTIATSGPAWAKGCERCAYGIVASPEVTGAVEFYLERVVQAVDGDLTFCTCKAGERYRLSLLNRHRKLIEDAKKDGRMGEAASRKSHPDIENARAAMLESHGKMARVPTVHFESVPTPAAQAEAVNA